MMTELTPVVLKRELLESGLRVGDVGTIVYVLAGGTYEVEFVTGDGDTVAVATLSDSDVRPLAAREILHARALPNG
jgi:hypothetical protein